jgi:hypothetical protein
MDPEEEESDYDEEQEEQEKEMEEQEEEEERERLKKFLVLEDFNFTLDSSIDKNEGRNVKNVGSTSRK